MKIPRARKGCPFVEKIVADTEHTPSLVHHSQCIVYGQTKLSHTGVSCWKTFEGFTRKIHKNSMSNLLNQLQKDYDGEPVQTPIPETRHLNEKQSRQIKKYSSKLCYYSRVRTFQSKKTGSYKFKVGFLTLTAPDSASVTQLIKAFEHFLDYLRRTANCHYVWKKELGEKSNHLHFHILVNNFIPYYLVAWKWKRLLLQEGVKWPADVDGKDYNSHYRIELPRSRKLIAHYIAKYMSKAHELPRNLGYIHGHSDVLDDLEEVRFIEGDLDKDELLLLQDNYKTIKDQFITHVCVDIRTVQRIAPTVYYWFMQQFMKFQDSLCLPQKYWYC